MQIINSLWHMLRRKQQRERYFTVADAWNGGDYELSIDLGERSDERLLSALRTLWNHPSLTGCYLHRDIEPYEQTRISPQSSHLHRSRTEKYYGIARLPNHKRVACATFVVRLEEGVDCLDLCISMGALGQAYPVGGFPFGYDPQAYDIWGRAIESWFAEIGQAVYAAEPFRFALIGFEIDYAEQDRLLREGVPDQCSMGYLWPEAGTLRYYPRSQWASRR